MGERKGREWVIFCNINGTKSARKSWTEEEKKIEISNTEFISLLIHCSPISSVTIEFILVRFQINVNPLVLLGFTNIIFLLPSLESFRKKAIHEINLFFFVQSEMEIKRRSIKKESEIIIKVENIVYIKKKVKEKRLSEIKKDLFVWLTENQFTGLLFHTQPIFLLAYWS